MGRQTACRHPWSAALRAAQPARPQREGLGRSDPHLLPLGSEASAGKMGLSRDPRGASREVREGRPSGACPQACRERSDHELVASGLPGQLQKTRGPQNHGLAHIPQEACLDSSPGQSPSKGLPSTWLVCPFQVSFTPLSQNAGFSWGSQ